MKKNLLFAPLLAFLLLVLGCKKKCENQPIPVNSGISADLQAWMSDSAAKDYAMIDADGTHIPWSHQYGAPSDYIHQNIDCVGDPAKQQVTRYHTYHYAAPSTGEQIDISLKSIDDVEFVELTFDDLAFRYAIATNTFLPTQAPDGIVNATGSLLQAYTVRGRTWSDVLYIDAQTPLVIYPKIWLAKGWGIIRYENQAGRAWERI